MPNPTALETDCEKTIILAARQFGWLVHGARPAQSGKGWRTPLKGDKGFPDLVFTRAGELIVRELKRKPNKVEPEQQRWLDALRASGVDADVLWVPEQQDEFIQTRLATRPRRSDAQHPHE